MHGHIVAVGGGEIRRQAFRRGTESTLGSRDIGPLETVLAGVGLPGGSGDAETALLSLRTQAPPRLAQQVMTHEATALAEATALDA